MKKALVMGGTRFFGVHLVRELIEKEFEVTVATRGNTKDSFGDSIKRVKIDRTDKQSMEKVFAEGHWDIVYDQICFSSVDALNAIDVFRSKTNRYVLTSSLSVYEMNAKKSPLQEENFNPYNEELIVGETEDFSYQEGKRQAEITFFQKAPFSVSAVRFPIVLGENDYTERLNSYIRQIKQNKPVHFDNPDAEMSFISEEEAGSFLAWLAESELEGPVNACSDGIISLQQLMNWIGNAAGKEVTYSESGIDSPYNIPETWTMTNEKAKKYGYSFSHLGDWLPDLIDKKVEEL